MTREIEYAGRREARYDACMQDPDKLDVTQEARSLAVNVYRATTDFPRDERFGITAQLRRAAMGIGSNISEGCGRSGNRELLHYLYSAHASASEVAFQLSVAIELGFGDRQKIESVMGQTATVARMLNRLTTRVGSTLAPKERASRRPARRSQDP
ncbi:MAG TPA: four helix bundle protein [Gemmatimonadaceae bacterium]|nr:four helix bundle protein [Gemmatimonadaceae bacterium]